MNTQTLVASRYALLALGLLLAASLSLMLFHGRTHDRELFVHSTALVATLFIGAAYSLALNLTRVIAPGVAATAFCVLSAGVCDMWAVVMVAINRPNFPLSGLAQLVILGSLAAPNAPGRPLLSSDRIGHQVTKQEPDGLIGFRPSVNLIATLGLCAKSCFLPR